MPLPELQYTHADVIVIGSGISGLTAAFRLQEAGRDVLLLEKETRFGGAIRSFRVGEHLVEAGPNSTLETTPLLTELIRDAGVEAEKMYADDRSKKRFILKRGRLIPIPMSPPAFFATPLFSLGAKLRLFREPFIGPSAPDSTESISDFVRRRLGTEFLDYAINPFVAGVYAGDPDTLSVRAAFPKLFELEQKYGGLIRGQIAGARERKRNPEKSKQSARMFSFVDGMETLPRALAARLGRKESGVDVARVERHDQSGVTMYRVHATMAGEAKVYTAPVVILATPAASAARIVGDCDPRAAEALRAIPYPPVAVVITAFRPREGAHPLDGFGFLIPQKERRGILGTIFTSTIFARRTAPGLALLTSFVGGSRQPGNALLPDDDIARLVRAELRELLGIVDEPAFLHITKWEHAIPQYTHGHLDRMHELDDSQHHNPGLHYCCNYRGGISVGDCVKSAHAVVDAILHTTR